MSKTILVAEDKILLGRLIKRVLQREGHSVILAQDGAEALNLLKQHVIDVALIDVNMPKYSGLAVLEVIQSTYPEVRTIITSGDIDSVYSHDASKRPSVYLAKPFRMERLLNLL